MHKSMSLKYDPSSKQVQEAEGAQLEAEDKAGAANIIFWQNATVRGRAVTNFWTRRY